VPWWLFEAELPSRLCYDEGVRRLPAAASGATPDHRLRAIVAGRFDTDNPGNRPMNRQARRQIPALFLGMGLLSAPCSADEAVDHFESKVRPLLVNRCHRCHATTAKAGLRLDSRAGVLKGGKSGPAAVPGAPRRSLLIQAVSGKHTRLKMPPKKALAAREVSVLVRWVRDGLPWGEMKTENTELFSKQQREFWSWQPLQPPRIPAVKPAEWNRNPVDAYIMDALGRQELQPAQPASKRTLIRRATFDLTGLPPTPEDVERFLADDSPQAYQRLLERLLDAPQYGERWGRHWLDVVRYADTAGDAADYPVPEAYKYRNYVIDAFNQDLPYDEFIRQQIAGDLLPFDSEDQRWRQTIATGYIAISRRIGVSPHGMRHITIEDTIDNLGKTFLGLTIGCARCHDHKFDPIPSTDYYALYGIFDSSIYPHAGAEHKPHREDFVYRVGPDRAAEMERSYRAALEPWNKAERQKFAEYQLFQKKKINDPSRTREIVWKELVALREQRRPFAEAFPDLEIAYAIQEGDPHDAQLQQAGDPRSTGELVRRGFPEILGGQKLPDDDQTSGRLALAGWIADPRNPLTARVMVNRIWHYHFGRGLVATTSDFGLRGQAPTHPELLDFLAADFIQHGWSIKHMHRRIMLSRTYRGSSAEIPENSAKDPENRLLWRANRRRLDAEQFRDALLTFSGELDSSVGQRHPFPHRLTYFYRQHEPFADTFASTRRSVYVMQQRIQKNPQLDMFDGPDGNLALSERKATTTTLQALFLMNSKFFHDRSLALAERLLQQKLDRRASVRWAYRTVFGRHPLEREVHRAEAYFDQAQRLLQSRKAETSPAVRAGQRRQVWSGYFRAMLASNEFMFVD